LVVDTGCIINGKVTTNPETKSTTIEWKRKISWSE
jgi:hypothetical protein